MIIYSQGEFEIRPFQPQDQNAIRRLLIEGLAEHWGRLNPSLNQDLNDIARSYLGETFLVAIKAKTIVGCGALIREKDLNSCGRIVRMSVMKQNRRQGIGQSILNQLQIAAQKRGFTKLVLETTETWHAAVNFYLANGFQIAGQKDGDLHFEKDLYG